MEEKDFDLMASELLKNISKDTSDGEFIFVTITTFLARKRSNYCRRI
ncbi:hypothetical protein [Lysinibacillus xylanilyticus]